MANITVLQTGYAFPSGTTAVVFTDGNPPVGHHYSVSLFGYLQDVPDFTPGEISAEIPAEVSFEVGRGLVS